MGGTPRITNAAVAGVSPAALMARSARSDFKTTQGYIDLAGEYLRLQANALEKRLWRPAGTKSGYEVSDSEKADLSESA